MSQQDDLVAAGRRLLINNYRQAPIVMARGEGCTLFDVEGRRYLDMTAGIAVCVLGHGHPGLADAIAAQARRLLHVSNLYLHRGAAAAGRGAVPARVPGPRVLLQLGRRGERGRAEAGAPLPDRRARAGRAHRDRRLREQLPRPHHGRAQRHRPAEVPRGLRAAGDARALRAVRRRRGGARRDHRAHGRASSSSRSRREGGINLPPPGYLQELRRACTDAGAVLIFDEIQTGVGRTGHLLRVRGRGRRPRRRDAGQGAGGRRSDRRDAGQRGGRARLRAGHARLDVRRQSVRDRRGALRPAARSTSWACSSAAARWARHLGSALLRLAERRRPKTRGARGRGLLQGLIIDGDPADVVARARAAGLLLSVAGANVVRFAPPLIVGKAEIDEAIEILDRVLAEAR